MARKIPRETIEKIRELRRKGLSLNEIKARVEAGYGTVFKYIQGVEIAPQYKKFWFGKRGGSIKRKKIAEEKALNKAKTVINSLSDRERLIFTTALYWGEGSKKDFGLSNSDPELIKVFVKDLEKIFKISRDKLRVSIRIFEDMNKDSCLEFWSKVVGIPPSKFVNVNILQGKKKGKLHYGLCRIRVSKGGNVLKYIIALRKVIAESYWSQ